MRKPPPSALMLRHLHEENMRWPVAMVEWPDAVAEARASGRPNPATRVWRSRHFLVQQFDFPGKPTRLTINRTTMRADGEWMDVITWDELQRIKREIGYGDRFAVEAYPEDEHLVNVANLRHLWLLPERPAWAWTKGAPP